MKKYIALLLLLSYIFVMFPAVYADSSGTAFSTGVDPDIRVGLYYNNAALPSANLANQIGSGYYFGFYDSQRSFIRLGFTAQEKITISKDKNMYVNSGNYYESLPPSGSTSIGAFHVDSGVQYSTFDEASAAANAIEASTGVASFPTYITGVFGVRTGTYTSLDSAAAAVSSLGISGGKAVGGSSTCYTVTVTATGKILFEFDSGSATGLAINPTGAEATVTWFKGYKYAGNFEYRRNNGNDITVINVLPISEYIKGVLPYEMNPNWHIEALKAQGISAASFALANLRKHGSLGFDVCNTTHCQVYRGRNSATANSDAAAEAVKGMGLYYNNRICSTVYHSSNGGSTESSKNVWLEDVPYLQAVPDNFENLTTANNGIWSFVYTKSDMTWILQNKNHSIGNIVDAYVDEYTPAGNVFRVSFVDSNGKKISFEKGATRTILNSETLKKYTHSQRYTISNGMSLVPSGSSSEIPVSEGYAIGAGGSITRLNGRSDVHILSASGTSALTGNTDSFIVSGRGWGHNVGMSQHGAKGMAEKGYTYDRILQYYFTGANVEPIR